MDLKSLSNSSEQLGGAVRFWLMPYRTLSVDAVITELQRIEPQFEYVHDLTGERRADVPDEYTAAIDTAKAIGVPLEDATHWKRRSLWLGIHDAFWRCEAITSAVEFRPGKQSAEVRALAAYWEARPVNIAERWELFQSVISADVANAWQAAWVATRDHSMDAPEELGAESASEKKDSPPLTPS